MHLDRFNDLNNGTEVEKCYYSGQTELANATANPAETFYWIISVRIPNRGK
jgi:hypothetical protein